MLIFIRFIDSEKKYQWKRFFGGGFPGKNTMEFKPFGFLRLDLPQAVKFEADLRWSKTEPPVEVVDVQGGLLSSYK